MATIRKLRKRWQAIVRRKRIHVSKTFWKKSDARLWSDKTEAQIFVKKNKLSSSQLSYPPTKEIVNRVWSYGVFLFIKEL